MKSDDELKEGALHDMQRMKLLPWLLYGMRLGFFDCITETIDGMLLMVPGSMLYWLEKNERYEDCRWLLSECEKIREGIKKGLITDRWL